MNILTVDMNFMRTFFMLHLYDHAKVNFEREKHIYEYFLKLHILLKKKHFRNQFERVITHMMFAFNHEIWSE